MPDYLVTDSQTGRKFKLTGDSPPTDAELTGIFGAQTESAGAPEPTSNQAADFARRIPEGMATGTGRTIQGLARAADIAQDAPPIPFMGGFGMERAAQTQIKVNQEIAAANRVRSATRQQRMEESPAYQFGAGTVEAAQGFYGVDRARDDEFVGQLATAAGEMVPTLVTGAFTGPIGAGVQYAASGGESQAQEAIAAGREDVADAAFLAAAGLGGLTEAALGVPGRLLSIINKARKAGVNPGKFGQWANRNPVKSGILRVGAEGAAREAAQEGLEQAGGNLIASDLAGYDPDRPVGQGVGRAMALGGVLGGVIGGGAAGVNQVNRNQQAAQLRTARTVRLTADGPELVVNEQTGTTEFPALENDWLPKPGVESQELRVERPALRGEAAMETRPSAEMGLDRTQPSTLNPELSTDLADTIAALRAGYRPEVEVAPPNLKPWADVLAQANDISIQEFAQMALAGKINKATGAASVNQDGTAKTALSMGHRAGYPLKDIAHFYASRRFESPDAMTTALKVGDPANNAEMRAAFNDFAANAAAELAALERLNRSARVTAGKPGKEPPFPITPPTPAATGATAVEPSKSLRREFKADENGNTLLLTKSSKPEHAGMVKVTEISPDGTPGGDRIFKTEEDAIRSIQGESVPDGHKYPESWPVGGKAWKEVTKQKPPAQPGVATPTPKQDTILALLDAADAKLKGPGGLMEGVTGLPVWATREAARGVIKVMRAAYLATRDIAAALRAGLDWLRKQNLKGFIEAEANAFITGLVKGEWGEGAMDGNKTDGLKLLDGDLDLGFKSTPTVFEIAMGFQNRFGRAIDYTNLRPEDNGRLVAALVQEIKRAVKLHPETLGWYDENLNLAMDVMKDLDPDLAKPENNFLFKAILAATSDGNKVGPQFKQTWQEYSHWKKHHQISGGFVSGDRGENIRANLSMLNELIARVGWEQTRDFMVRKGTVAELRQALVDVYGWTKEEANKIGTAERIDERVPFAIVLGPKLGSFFANLYGDYSSVTMDRWFMRTIGRLTGTLAALLPEGKLREMRNRLRDAVSKLTPEQFSLLNIPRGRLVGSGINDSATTISGRFAKKELREVAQQLEESGQPALVDVRLAANALKKGLRPMAEAPDNGTHRRWIRERIDEVQQILKADGIEMENADLQAVLWYLEKELYEKLKYRVKQGDNDYAAAANSVYEAIDGRQSPKYRRGLGRIRAIGDGSKAVVGGAAEGRAAPIQSQEQVDSIEATLDSLESKLKDTPGTMLEGVTGAPVWLTKAALRGVVQVVRVAYRASKDLALALRAGLEWLRDQNLRGFDEAQAHGWLAKTITEGSSVDGLNIRATSDLLAASPLIPDEVRELIANVTYEVVTDQNAVDFANRILDALGDPSAALPILADASNGLGGKRRTVLAFLTLLRLSQAITQAKAAGDTATVQRLAETEAAVYDYTLADRITDAAQTLQAVSVFSKLSPEGRLIHARRRIQRAGDRDLDPLKAQLNDALEKLEKAKKDLADETARGREIQEQAAKAIADALEAEAQRARTALQNAIHLNASNSLEMLPSVWQKAQAAVLQQWHKLGADELVKNLTGRAGQALENSLWSAIQQKGGAQSTVASVIAQVNRALHEQVNRALNVKPEQFINPATYAMRLRHALGNAEVMSRIWEQTRAAVGANLRAIGEMEGLLLRIGEEIALLEAQAKLPLEGGPEVTATDAKLRQSQQGARDAMLAGRNAGIAQTIVQKRERLADVEAQLAEYRKMEPAWRAVLAMTVDVWGPNLVRGVMAEQMKADGFRLRKAVSDHFRGLHGAPDPMQSLGSLTAKIVAASGLDEQAAGRLAASIEAEFVAQVEKERAKVAERIKAAAVRKAARAADAPRREAESLIDRLQELQTEWLRPPGKRSAIQALVRQAIRSEPGAQFQDETAFRNAVQAGLVALGVPEQSAARLAYETWQAKQARDAGREGDRLDQLIRERMDALKLNLGKLVREHWSKVERAGESLAEQLAGEGGLTPEGAQKLAAAFERRFNQLAQAKLKRELEQVLKPVTRSAIAKPGLVEKLMGLLRLGAFSNEAYWKAVMERLKLPEFSEALRDRLTAIGARLDALPESDIEGRHRVSVEFLNALEQAAGIDPLDLSLGFYVTNLLTGIPTHVANTSANFFAAIANAGIQMELAIAEGRYDDIPAAIEAAAVGLKKALPQAGQVMRTGILPAVRQGQARALRPMELAQFGTRGGVPLRDTGMVSRSAKWALESYPAKILNLWKLNGRAMAAEDLLAFTPAMEVQRVLLARRVARAEGLRGEALRNRVAGLLTDADPAQVEDAREFALRVVNSATPYGFVGAVVNLINQAKGSEHRALRGAANIVAPVLTIPMNAFNESLNYTPVGLWRLQSGVTNLLGREVKNLSLEQQQDLRAELLAKALTGTLFLTAAALMFAQFLDDDDPALALYGTGPQDMANNKGWRERGALPHSLKVGDTYFSFALTPIAAPLSALGNWFDRERDVRIYGKKRSDSLGTQAGVALLSSLDVLFEQPFMVGFVDLFRLAGNTQGSDETKVRSGFRRAAKTASSFVVPNEVRNIDRYFNPKMYPVRDLEGALISSVPFVRGMGGKPALNALGQPIESQPFHRFLSRQAADPLIRGLDAKGAWPTVLDDRNKVWPAKRRAMTEGEFYSYQAETGKALDRKLRAEWPAWSRLPDAIARDKVNEAATKERAIWRSRNGWGRL